MFETGMILLYLYNASNNIYIKVVSSKRRGRDNWPDIAADREN